VHSVWHAANDAFRKNKFPQAQVCTAMLSTVHLPCLQRQCRCAQLRETRLKSLNLKSLSLILPCMWCQLQTSSACAGTDARHEDLEASLRRCPRKMSGDGVAERASDGLASMCSFFANKRRAPVKMSTRLLNIVGHAARQPRRGEEASSGLSRRVGVCWLYPGSCKAHKVRVAEHSTRVEDKR